MPIRVRLPQKSREQNDNAPPRKHRLKARHSPPTDFSKMLAEATLRNKVAPLLTKDKRQIRLRALQHMVVCNLRRDLAGEVKAIYDNESAPPDQMERVRKLMKHYVGALRDLRYMLEPPSQNEAVSRFLIDRLYITDERDPAILVDVGITTPHRYKPDLYVPEYTGYGGYSYSQEAAQRSAKDFVSRLRMALFGGVSLIAPMLVMRLHPTLLTELVTTSVFILVVGVVLAWYMKDAQKRDILAATASYAAVLVVFVGTTS